MMGPERLAAQRLQLRRPTASDAAAIYAAYASDPEVTRYLSWTRHTSLAHTRAFLEFSGSEWRRWPAGPYLIESAAGEVLGSTGFAFETAERAATGYVLRRSAWGKGYATEALGVVVRAAPELGVRRLYALCHPQHTASVRVLEKCAFGREGILRAYAEFPNERPGELQDVLCYSRIF
jgi:[ribosomal protein S5]-alanine N-acetyltransferase